METINHETYCGHDLITLLLKVGFDWKAYFIAHDINEHFHWEMPLHIAQRWLREVRHRSIEVKSFVDGTVDNRGKWWIWHVYDFNPPIDWVLLMSSDCRYSTYEEAQEAGIKKALELILEKGK